MKDLSKGLIGVSGTVFTDSQKEGINVFKDWYLNNRSNIFVFTGAAGTGKTFLMKYIADNIIKGKRKVVTAPTHKAVRVIERSTGMKGFTWHSIHGLRPTLNIDDFNINSLSFDTVGDHKFGSYQVIIGDEASMLNKSIKKLNDLRSTQYNTKIIYLGDELQLLPVKENKISSIFDNKYRFKLTDIVRQKEDNEIIKVLDILRVDVENESSTFIDYLYKNKYNLNNGLGYVVVNNYDFKSILTNKFESDEFKVNPNSYRIGTYTNARVSMWNRFVRALLTDSKDILTKGDILMGYKTIVDSYLQPVIINSNDYIVVNVDSKMSDNGFKLYVTLLRDIETGFEKEVYIVDHRDDSFIKYVRKLELLHNNALGADRLERSGKWKEYYNFKDTFMTMIKFPIHANSFKEQIVDREIDYGYASTIHKLQGSTIENILLDAMDMIYYTSSTGNNKELRTNTINNPNAINNRNRLMYTGLSRASKQAIILLY